MSPSEHSRSINESPLAKSFPRVRGAALTLALSRTFLQFENECAVRHHSLPQPRPTCIESKRSAYNGRIASPTYPRGFRAA